MALSEGFKVFGTSRYPEKYLKEVPFELLALDVNSQEFVDNCIALLFSKIRVLNVLVNNAGNMLSGNAEEITEEAAIQQFGINFWDTVRVTKSVY